VRRLRKLRLSSRRHGYTFGCELQITDAASARAIAADLLEAAATIEARTKPQLKLVEN